MKALVIASALSSAAIPTTMFYDGMPPARFQGPAKVKVVFGRVNECGNAGNGHFFESCIRHGVTYLPDPCAYPQETFARLACHEIAHTRGWAKDHGE